MNCARRSIVWKLSVEEFSKVIKESKSYREALSKLGLENHGGNPKTVKKRIFEEGIDDSHIRNVNKTDLAHLKISIPLDEILVENSFYNSGKGLKKKLLKHKLMAYKCSLCDNSGEWKSKKLVLQIDHKNGKHNDNRLSNLRLLCPNCHSQTPTFAGRALRKKQKSSILDPSWRNKPRLNRRKVDRPDLQELQRIVKELGFSATGRKFGVSDNAIRKWLKTPV